VIYNFMFPRTYGGDRPGPRSGQTAHWSVDGGESRHFRIVACANVRFVTAAFAAAHAECAAVRRSPGRGW
jgi:hypothetical protein